MAGRNLYRSEAVAPVDDAAVNVLDVGFIEWFAVNQHLLVSDFNDLPADGDAALHEHLDWIAGILEHD